MLMKQALIIERNMLMASAKLDNASTHLNQVNVLNESVGLQH